MTPGDYYEKVDSEALAEQFEHFRERETPADVILDITEQDVDWLTRVDEGDLPPDSEA
jgi:hypothetical protein